MMRRQLALALAIAVLWSVPPVQAQNLLDGPDHVSYDEANDRYLVSSSLNQAIVAINRQGEQSYFLSGLGSYIFGHLISGDTLYVGDSRGSVRAFDLNTRALLWTKFIPGGHYFGGLAMDSSGYLYIADNQAFDSKIYKMNPADQTWETFVSSGLGGYTSKVIYDELNNRLLVIAHYIFSPILAVDLSDASLTPLVTPPAFNLGGIVMDHDRNVYVTNYYQGAVYRYDQTFTNPPVFIAQGDYSHACGIGYDHVHNLLMVSYLENDVVQLFSLDDTDGDGTLDIIDNCPDTFNPDQEDYDHDGIGDSCDVCTDTDQDGFGDPGFTANTCAPDNCPEDWNADQFDLDHDNVGDECDNCLWIYNPDQEDLDENNIGDACEGCCRGRVGDANNSGDDEPTISDIGVMIDAKFISGTCEGIIDCLEETDINQSGGVTATCDDITISDISMLIDYLFITGQSVGLLECL